MYIQTVHYKLQVLQIADAADLNAKKMRSEYGRYLVLSPLALLTHLLRECSSYLSVYGSVQFLSPPDSLLLLLLLCCGNGQEESCLLYSCKLL